MFLAGAAKTCVSAPKLKSASVMMRSSLFIVCPFLCSVESFRYCFLQLAFGSAGFFERSAKSLFGLRLCARLGLAFLPCSAVRCHFEPFAKRRKIHALRCNLHFKFMDTSLSLSMTSPNDKANLAFVALRLLLPLRNRRKTAVFACRKVRVRLL